MWLSSNQVHSLEQPGSLAMAVTVPEIPEIMSFVKLEISPSIMVYHGCFRAISKNAL